LHAKFSTLLLAIIASAGALFAMGARCANRNALRQIVQEQCLVHWVQQHDPTPCERVEAGYAVLADRKGGAHFLLIPTKVLAGIESAELLNADTPNYFSAAWQARDRVAAVVGHRVSRDAVGLAVNPPRARSQDQLHIHIECLRPDVFMSLHEAAEAIKYTWSTVRIGGAHYDALRIMGEDLDGTNPFELLAKHIPPADHVMGDYTLVLAGMQFSTGPGFILLASAGPAGELLLDSTCAIAAD
jgi:CDP-diacylglycerol pyrophosphatase